MPARAGVRSPERCLCTTRVLGLRVDSVSREDIVATILNAVDAGERALVVNANAHLLTLAPENPWLPGFFDGATIAFCDGAGVQLASALLNGTVPIRSTPPEWSEALGTALAARGKSVFWLGGAPTVTPQAAALFERRTGIRTAGWAHGYFDHRAGSADNASLLAMIRAAKPDLLLVNMGMPVQERWLHDHWHLLDVPAAVTAGALVDHVAGRVRRPPRWVSDCGMEWAVRLAREPGRLWRRYLVGLPVLGFRIAKAMLRQPRRPLLLPTGTAARPASPALLTGEDAGGLLPAAPGSLPGAPT